MSAEELADRRSDSPGSQPAWESHREQLEAGLDPWPAQALSASLDLDPIEGAPAEALPPLWHWLYFLETAQRSQIGTDGHPQRGRFLPPIDLPRRMFAGGRLQFLSPLRLGRNARQTREVIKVAEKASASGQLVYVTVAYDYEQDGSLCVREERDFVFLSPQPARPLAAPVEIAPSEPHHLWLTPDPTLLFRFSALTFNSHRIHYDLPYTQGEEGLPERVVHGPLTAILLAEMARLKAKATLRAFEFQARRPFFVNQPMLIEASSPSDGSISMTARSAHGGLMVARATVV